MVTELSASTSSSLTRRLLGVLVYNSSDFALYPASRMGRVWRKHGEKTKTAKKHLDQGVQIGSASAASSSRKESVDGAVSSRSEVCFRYCPFLVCRPFHHAPATGRSSFGSTVSWTLCCRRAKDRHKLQASPLKASWQSTSSSDRSGGGNLSKRSSSWPCPRRWRRIGCSLTP